MFLIDDTKDADTDEFANQQKKPEPKGRKASPVQLKRLKEFYGDRFGEYLKANGFTSEDEITMTVADKSIEKITEYERRKGDAVNGGN